MPDNCPLCERQKASRSDFCALHDAAFKNLEEAYATWTKAYDGLLTREEYYDRLLTRAETGQAAKDVINHFRAKGAD